MHSHNSFLPNIYQNYYLEALSPEDAEQEVIERFRRDKELKNLVLNDEDDRPSFDIDEIHELESFEGIESMVSGRAWYDEDAKDS